ncbi:CDP-glycerol glycerophosphotransferase family protein [Streptosporangiaceae bacterium NEAU-GS5]|nr:CDP-glycerol glycerophosphotransferase family protein [Streptosporangiaceae bacterium NEAU-GS5]
MATALWPLPWAFAVVAALSYVVEFRSPVAVPTFTAILSKVHLGITVRFVIREMAAVLLVARVADTSSRWFAGLAVGLFLLQGGRTLQTTMAYYLNRWVNAMPVLTRNIDLSALRIPPRPPAAIVNYKGARLLYLDAIPVVGAAVGAAVGLDWLGVAASGVALLWTLGAIVVLVPYLSRAAGLRHVDRVIGEVNSQIATYGPEILLYFSGSADSVYQINMWLGTLEKIDRRTLVVLRERGMIDLLGPTTLPVICIPSGASLMNFRSIDAAKVSLFAANVGKNIHMLRIPGHRSVFIGHGDSDKEASFNPFTKVYDEVWVAGPAGRDRYRRAGVGVRDDAIVEVGRPQLAGISTSRPRTNTVLYAPTWEGWQDDLAHTSVDTVGVKLVKALIKSGVRVIYKPHPLTGHRDPKALAAHKKILAAVRAAGGGHKSVIGSEPHLYDCFNEADLLISDISSVVADFIASGKPYAVTNVAARPEAEFRERYPTTEAGYLIGPKLAELPAILAELDRDEDTLAAARGKLKTYLLGPDEPDALTRFNAAINRLCEL